jgi:hypothetical protein
VKVRKVIRKRIRHDKDGVHIAGDINAVVAGNINEGRGARSTSTSRQRIVQKARRTASSKDSKKGGDQDGG